jgi:CheY-like chemotaxis protein
MASRLLVADDSTTIQKIVSMAFENEDVEVEGVGDGQEAFDRIAEFNPDIVLADVDMPGLDGFELSAKIKESSETSGIKVLLLASDFEDFDEQRYQTCGANNHISKPFKSDDIVTMVKSLLEGNDDLAALTDVDMPEENPVEQDSTEIIEQSQDGTEAASEILENLKVPEPQEEPSLEELLDSVEKLSSEGTETPDLEGEEALEDETPMNEELELPDPVELSADNEVLDLAGENSMEPIELSEPVELSVDNEVLDLAGEDSMEPMELSELSGLLEDPVTPEPEEEAPDTALENDDDIMDQMIRGVEELKESVQPASPDSEEEFSFVESESDELESYNAEEPEIFAEVRPRKMDDMDDLDSAFKELSKGGRPDQASHEEKRPELSSLGGIVPEPEDLLEQIAPGAFSEVGKRPATPEDIKENLDYISGFSDHDNPPDMDPRNLRSRDWNYEAGDDLFIQAIAEEVKQVLKRSLGSSLEKEVYGLSDAILKTIREVVREVTPEIARRVIREEIEKIKKQDMY